MGPRSVGVLSHNISGIVNRPGIRETGAGYVNGREAPTKVKEAVPNCGGIRIAAHNGVEIVNPMGKGSCGAGNVDRDETSPQSRKPCATVPFS
jgi:hypothetical protein